MCRLYIRSCTFKMCFLIVTLTIKAITANFRHGKHFYDCHECSRQIIFQLSEKVSMTVDKTLSNYILGPVFHLVGLTGLLNITADLF